MVSLISEFLKFEILKLWTLWTVKSNIFFVAAIKEVRNVTMSYHNANNYYHYNSNSSYHLSLSLLLLSHMLFPIVLLKSLQKFLLTNEKNKDQKDITNVTYLLTLKSRCVAVSDFVSLFSPLHYSASFFGVPYYSVI